MKRNIVKHDLIGPRQTSAAPARYQVYSCSLALSPPQHISLLTHLSEKKRKENLIVSPENGAGRTTGQPVDADGPHWPLRGAARRVWV